MHAPVLGISARSAVQSSMPCSLAVCNANLYTTMSPQDQEAQRRTSWFSSALTRPHPKFNSNPACLSRGGGRQAKEQRKSPQTSTVLYQMTMQLYTNSNSPFSGMIDRLRCQTTLGRGGRLRWIHREVYIVKRVIVLEEDPRATATRRPRSHAALIVYHARA